MLDIVHYVVSTNVINDFEWRVDKVDQAGEQYIYTTNLILPKHVFWAETKIYNLSAQIQNALVKKIIRHISEMGMLGYNIAS